MLKHALGSSLLLSATHVLALSLGGTQGAAVIGRPMDVLVSSSLDAADAASGLCLEAQVMYGETPVPASAVTVAIHKLGSDGKGALRVRTTVPVNEPIVSLTLKAGCESPFRRSYTLLADFESASVASAVATTASRDVTVPVATGRAASEPVIVVDPQTARKRQKRTDSSLQTSSSAAAREVETEPTLGPETPVRLEAPVGRPPGTLRVSSKTRVATHTATGAAADVRQPIAASAGARLQLEAIDLTAQSEQLPVAGTNTTLPSAVENSPSPEPAATPIAEQALQEELKSLRAEQERLRVAVESMNTQLAQAQSDRYNTPLTYGLGLGVAGLLAAVLYLLRRQKPKPPADSWWSSSLMPGDSVSPALAEASGPDLRAGVAAASVDNELTGLEAVEAGVSVFQEVPISRIEPQVLLDMWEQADFLASIGQVDEVLHLLETFVQIHPRASEGPYLRWMQLASQLGNATSLAKAQSAYENHYHRLFPSNALNAAGLEEEASFVMQLSQAWPGAQAMAQIDAVLFSQPGEQLFALGQRSLKVFDDLLSLRRLLGVLEALPPGGTEPAMVHAMSGATDNLNTVSTPVLPLATESDAAQWMSIDPPADETPPVADMLELDLSSPSSVANSAAAPEATGKVDLPPLDFDFFEFDPDPGQPGKKPG